jgi:hypothetical protein
MAGNSMARVWFAVFGFLAAMLHGRVTVAGGAPHVHDGIFFEAGAYVGPQWTRYDATVNTPMRQHGTLQSGSAGIGLAVGGTPAPGLVLAALGVSHLAVQPRWDAPPIEQGWDSVSSSLLMLGPLLRYYPDPRGGFHVDGLVALAFHRVTSARTDLEPSVCPLLFPACFELPETNVTEVRENATGIGTGIGAGYDFWLGRQWSLGLTLRVDYAHTWGVAGTYEDLAPALGASVVYH